jgi:cytochrome c
MQPRLQHMAKRKWRKPIRSKPVKPLPPKAAEEGPAFADVLAAADPAAGEKVFGKCKACHKLDGTDGTGPHLNGVVNRAKASVGGFGYSEALVAMAADAWSPENLNGFLENPKGYMPGTKMSFAGLGKVEDRANVIAYLATLP